MKKVMISGVSSGSGKTTVTIGIMKALINRGYEISAFKCGPDYIDPMFHEKIVKASGHNLDSVFCDNEMINYLLEKNALDFSVIEGVMGYYDGVGEAGSSCEISIITDTPAIIVIDCKGMSGSIGAIIKGFLEYKENNIAGFIFNRLPESLEDMVKRLCDENNTEYFGRLPFEKTVSIESRHLGLLTANEVKNLEEKVDKLGELCENYIDLDKLLKASTNNRIKEKLASTNNKIKFNYEAINNRIKEKLEFANNRIKLVKIAIACDEAFCFIYRDNIDFLNEVGCEIVKFSPIHDKNVPDGISGLIIPGGYPELYAKELSENKSMLESIREAVNTVPTIAECGGFMYLHDEIILSKGESFELAGVIRGKVYKKDRLVRFGYIRMNCNKDNIFGEKSILAHEYHYYESTNNGEDFMAEKLSRPMEYRVGHVNECSYFGFPHIYFYGNIDATKGFIEKCIKYNESKG